MRNREWVRWPLEGLKVSTKCPDYGRLGVLYGSVNRNATTHLVYKSSRGLLVIHKVGRKVHYLNDENRFWALYLHYADDLAHPPDWVPGMRSGRY